MEDSTLEKLAKIPGIVRVVEDDKILRVVVHDTMRGFPLDEAEGFPLGYSNQILGAFESPVEVVSIMWESKYRTEKKDGIPLSERGKVLYDFFAADGIDYEWGPLQPGVGSIDILGN